MESSNLDLTETPDSSPPALSACTTFPSPSPPATPDEGAPLAAPSRGRKRRRVDDIETQKLDVLKQMAALYTGRSSHFASFGNQVAVELELINDPATVSRLKKT
ncbi:hypothetical protein ABVT39_020206 [Epinephelus coioides]